MIITMANGKFINGDDSSASSACSGSPSGLKEAEDPCTSHMSKVLEQKIEDSVKKAFKQPPSGLQLEQCLENVHLYPDETDPLDF